MTIQQPTKQAPLTRIITSYYQQRSLVWPTDADTALQWAMTELGEVMELLLSRKAEWVRNNPGEHQYDEAQFLHELGEELGDVIMMCVVAGIVKGVCPVSSLLDKLDGKLRK